MLCYVGTLSASEVGDDGICVRVFFVALFLEDFPLVATLVNVLLRIGKANALFQ